MSATRKVKLCFPSGKPATGTVAFPDWPAACTAIVLLDWVPLENPIFKVTEDGFTSLKWTSKSPVGFEVKALFAFVGEENLRFEGWDESLRYIVMLLDVMAPASSYT